MKSAALVMLGATGDLVKRKLLPALLHINKLGIFPSDAVIIGSGRTELSTEKFRDLFDLPDEFKNRLFYHQGIAGLKQYIKNQHGSFKKTLIFCALPPSAYVETVRQLKKDGFGDEIQLIIEKPFGHNLESAKDLNRELVKNFNEKQIYRIDHYLAKEAVRNLMVLRFANPVFMSTWNSSFIESIQISALETIGVGSRGSYFDNAGTIRDMVQNHLLQMISLTCMEPPENLTSECIKTSKINFIKSLEVKEVKRGQYEGYLLEKGVAPHSNTETFTELVLESNTERWNDCPIQVRAGKGCSDSAAEIGITFRPIAFGPYKERKNIPPNRIIVKIQPTAGIILDFATRTPGSDDLIDSTSMNFCYHDNFSHDWPDAYEKLLIDALNGDSTLFISATETEAAWKLLDPHIGKGEMATYRFGETPKSFLNINWTDFTRYCRRH